MQKNESRHGLKFIIGTVLVLLVCALLFLELDRLILSYFLALDPALSQIFNAITQAGDSLYPLVLAAAVILWSRWQLRRQLPVAKMQCWQRWRARAVFLFLAVASSGLLADLIKVLCGRPRPVKWLTENLYGFYLFETSAKMQSFPSGHSNTAAAIGLTLWYIWPKSWPLGLALTGAVITSRVVLLKHFPSDTLAGAWLAVVTTFYVYRYCRKKYPTAFAQKEERSQL